MWIQLQPNADARRVARALDALGVWARAMAGDGARGFLVQPHSAHVTVDQLRSVPGVADVLVSRSAHPRVDAQAGVGVLGIGGGPAVLIAGPCSVESEASIHAVAADVASAGGRFLRGGAFKPRTSPYGFTGHGRAALGWLRSAADAHGLGVVTEVLAEDDVQAVAEVADLIQIGSRTMQSFALLHAVGRTGRPVLLKRGMAATIEEWLLAGEHLLHAGSSGVVFCERGVRGFDPSTRNLLDLGAVALLHHALGQPVLADPSHAAGRRDLIAPLARAALAAGADGLLVEVHPDPASALTDAPQALRPEELSALGFGGRSLA